MVENKSSMKDFQNFSFDTTFQQFSSVSNNHHAISKINISQANDVVDNSSLELTEYDFQLSDTLQSIVFFSCIFGLLYAFSFRNESSSPNRFGEILENLSVKKFILIRSIRI